MHAIQIYVIKKTRLFFGGQHGQAAGDPGQQGEGGRGGVPEAGAEADHGAHCLLLHVTAVLCVGSLQHHLLVRPRGGAVLQSPAVLAAVAGWQLLAGPRLGLPSSFSKRQLQRAWHWTLYLASQAPGTH